MSRIDLHKLDTKLHVPYVVCTCIACAIYGTLLVVYSLFISPFKK